MIEFRAMLIDLENNSKCLLCFKIFCSSHKKARLLALNYMKRRKIYRTDERVRDYVTLVSLMEIPEGVDSSGSEVDIPPEVLRVRKIHLDIRRIE